MDNSESTQKSTQPYQDPRRAGINKSDLSDSDVADIICILHPQSHLARKAVVVATRTSPQHVLQNDDLIPDLERIGDEDDDFDAKNTTRDIALRMSSKLKHPHMGFCFGRNAERCDLVLNQMSISNAHFRIYLNMEGVLMLEDTSSNGTFVDNQLLHSKKPNSNPKRQTLAHGSIIKTVTSSRIDEARFIVRLPSREGHEEEHRQKLVMYLTEISRLEGQHRAVLEAKARGEWNGGKADLAKPILAVNNHTQPAEPSRFNIASTLTAYSHGMHWSGGMIYNVVGQIGKGAFATVYKLTTKNDGKVFAAKELDKRRFMKNGVLDMKVDNEMKIMKGLRHPNIVQYIDYHDHDQWLYIIMEYVPGGELSTYVQKNGPVSEYQSKIIARQVLHALDYLHRRKITHRDIKPDNILIMSLDPLRVKLSDFGLSKVVNQETFLKTFCGTLLYCAPEVYPDYGRYKRGDRKRRRVGDPAPRTSPYSQAVDMWSFGAVLFHILCNHPPYLGRGDDKGAEMLRNIMTSEADFHELRACNVSDQSIDFISKLLNRDPSQRPREDECFRHPWIAEVPDDDLLELVVDDLIAENGALGAIDEVQEEEELDCSQLKIEDDLGPLDFSSDGEDLVVNELVEEPSKRARLGESRIDIGSTAATPEIRYPELPDVNAQRPGRLFGEITASALRSSGVLGRDTDVALAANSEGSGDNEQLPDFQYDERGSSDEGGSVNHYLRSHGDVLVPSSLAGSAPSLFGAEALVGQLHMESPHSRDHSPASTTNTTNPVTPETPKTREASPGRFSHLVPSDTDSTPKVLRPAVPAEANAGAAENTQDQSATEQFGISLVPNRNELVDTAQVSGNVSNSRLPSYKSLIPTGPTITRDQRPDDSIPDTAAETPNESHLQVPALTFANSVKPARSNLNGFVKPHRCLGKITSLPGSFADVKFRLEQRMTVFGRGELSTVRFHDVMDPRVPKYGLEITFWCEGIEKMEQDNMDWTQIPDVMTVISTKTQNRIWVNDVDLTSKTPDNKRFNFGKLYTGDVITIHRGSKSFLKLGVEIYHGVNARNRPEKEKPFVIESSTFSPSKT